MKVCIPWDESEIELALPDDWRVIAEARPRNFAPCASVAGEYRRALAAPMHASTLAARDLRGKRFVLVMDDLTRPTPAQLLLPLLLADLERTGADLNNARVLVALGVHRPMTESEMARKAGRETLARVRWENHDAYAAQRLAHLGTTSSGTPVFVNRALVEADLIISVSSIEPHVLAGFGGGLKNLVPGCAGAETIARNHLVGTTGREIAQIGVDPDSNPLRRDLEEAAGLLKAEVFLVNTVLNPRQEIVRIFAGDARAAHREGVHLAREIYGVRVPEPADVVITNSAPMDSDLRQGAKCIGNTLAAVKERGTILALLRCREGVGDFKLSGKSLPRPMMRALVRTLSRERLLSFLERFRQDLQVEEKFLAFYSLQILGRNEVFAYAPEVPQKQLRRFPFLRAVREPQELIRRAASLAPRNASVAVFPEGGVTFPVVAAST